MNKNSILAIPTRSFITLAFFTIYILPSIFKFYEYDFSFKGTTWDFSIDALLLKTLLFGAMMLGVLMNRQGRRVRRMRAYKMLQKRQISQNSSTFHSIYMHIDSSQYINIGISHPSQKQFDPLNRDTKNRGDCPENASSQADIIIERNK